jgi:prepilin peptidase CpaA
MELVQGCAITAAGLAAATDVWSRRIPNWVTLGTFLIGIVLNTRLHGVDGALAAFAGAALGLGLLLPFYLLGVIGAGDVKLLAALGAVLGPQALITVAIYGALVGGLMSVTILGMRGQLFLALSDVVIRHRPPARSGATAPYGVAIAAGVVLSVFLPSVIA